MVGGVEEEGKSLKIRHLRELGVEDVEEEKREEKDNTAVV